MSWERLKCQPAGKVLPVPLHPLKKLCWCNAILLVTYHYLVASHHTPTCWMRCAIIMMMRMTWWWWGRWSPKLIKDSLFHQIACLSCSNVWKRNPQWPSLNLHRTNLWSSWPRVVQGLVVVCFRFILY